MSQQPLFNRWDGLLAAGYRGLCKHGWLRRALGWQVQLPTCPQPRTVGRLHLEIVSHCWNYAHLLTFQLQSVVRFPPTASTITMTIFYNDSDVETRALLDWCQQQKVEGVTWAFHSLQKSHLFRRAIGRNQAGLATKADWIWFTDCDVIFGENFLDALASELQTLDYPLVYPAVEYRTPPLPSDHAWFARRQSPANTATFDPSITQPVMLDRATGPMQIVRGDVARAVGYCRQPRFYQKPAKHWCKATEDRVFRWQLGTQGVAINAGPVYRLQHQAKGRYRTLKRILELIARVREHRLSGR